MHRKYLALVIIALSVISDRSMASASFDCAKASAPIEKAICSSKPLSDMDAELAKSFSEERRLLSPDFAELLVKEQRGWLADRLSACQISKATELPPDKLSVATACLIGLYRDRLNHLNALMAENGNWEEKVRINDEPHVAIIIKDKISQMSLFNKQSRGSGTFTECELVINVPFYHANNYGGVCTINRDGKYSHVKVCADDMVGNFEMVPSDESDMNVQGLAEFVFSHCTGG